jgi:hypothetical protein
MAHKSYRVEAVRLAMIRHTTLAGRFDDLTALLFQTTCEVVLVDRFQFGKIHTCGKQIRQGKLPCRVKLLATNLHVVVPPIVQWHEHTAHLQQFDESCSSSRSNQLGERSPSLTLEPGDMLVIVQ